MTAAQRDLLMKVLDAYAGLMAPTSPPTGWRSSRSPASRTSTFAWAGSIERGQKHYYRVQGPTFLIEFDNTQNDGNHVHSVWRDFRATSGATCCASTCKTSLHIELRLPRPSPQATRLGEGGVYRPDLCAS